MKFIRQFKKENLLRLMWCIGLIAAMTKGSTAEAIPLISEILYDATGADSGGVFVELYGDSGEDLSGLSLVGINGADGRETVEVFLSGWIPEDGLFVVADEGEPGITEISGADLILNFDFQNGPDSIQLRSGSTVLDAVGYGDFSSGSFFAGEGNPAADTSPGQSLARIFANVDLNDNQLDFQLLDAPTPGTAPLASVPEPQTASLLLLGFMTLSIHRRIARTRR